VTKTAEGRFPPSGRFTHPDPLILRTGRSGVVREPGYERTHDHARGNQAKALRARRHGEAFAQVRDAEFGMPFTASFACRSASSFIVGESSVFQVGQACWALTIKPSGRLFFFAAEVRNVLRLHRVRVEMYQ